MFQQEAGGGSDLRNSCKQENLLNETLLVALRKRWFWALRARAVPDGQESGPVGLLSACGDLMGTRWWTSLFHLPVLLGLLFGARCQ